jgi:hypothetical protein
MLELSRGALQAFKRRYQDVKLPTDPPTFEEFEAQMEPGAPYIAAFQLFQQIIDSPAIGQAIFQMEWHRLSISSTVPLLTSDRPLVMPYGISAGIALPINPYSIFIASPEGRWYNTLRSTNPTKVARLMNLQVVQQARKYVWGVDALQLPFIQKWMSTLPDVPIITDEQRRKALEAAEQWRP